LSERTSIVVTSGWPTRPIPISVSQKFERPICVLFPSLGLCLASRTGQISPHWPHALQFERTEDFYVPEFDLVGLIVDPVLNSGWGTLYEKSKFRAFLRKEILIVQDMLRVRRVQQWHGTPAVPMQLPEFNDTFLSSYANDAIMRANQKQRRIGGGSIFICLLL